MIFGNSTFANATKRHNNQTNRYTKNQTPSLSRKNAKYSFSFLCGNKMYAPHRLFGLLALGFHFCLCPFWR